MKTVDGKAGRQSAAQIAGKSAKVRCSNDAAVTETVRPEHAIHELAPDASGLAVGQDEELRQLQGSVAHDATGIPDSGPVLLRDPGVRSGAGEVIE